MSKGKKGKSKILRYLIGALVLVCVIIGLGEALKDKNTSERSAQQTAAQITAAPAAEPTATFTPEPTAAPTPTPTPAPTDVPVLKNGSSGEAVKRLQQALIDLHYLTGAADGEYGEKTRQAVKDFQLVNGLAEDGVAGEATQKLLYGNPRVNRTVYVSKSGVYHTNSTCSGMKTSTEMPLSDAIRKGYTAHDNCN